jgi:micrococcal nuclease
MAKITRQQLSTALVLFVTIFGLILTRLSPQTDQEIRVPPSSSAPASVTSTSANVHPQTATSTLPVVVWPVTVSSNAIVTKAVDGDTVDLLFDGETKIVRIRMLGINTPESVDPRRPQQCFGKEASKHMKELVTGERVAALPDPQADDRDKYGRLLRTIILEEGNVDVNATLVAQGYAHGYLDFPLDKKRKAQILQLQADAKANGYGLWNEQTCNGEDYKE